MAMEPSAGCRADFRGKRRVNGQVADAGDLRDKDVFERRKIPLQFGGAQVSQSKCLVDLVRGGPFIRNQCVEAIAEPLNIVDRRYNREDGLGLLQVDAPHLQTPET